MRLTKNAIHLDDIESCRLFLDAADPLLNEKVKEQTGKVVLREKNFRRHLAVSQDMLRSRLALLYHSIIDIPDLPPFQAINKKFYDITAKEITPEDVWHFRLIMDYEIPTVLPVQDAPGVASHFARTAHNILQYANQLDVDRTIL